MTSDSSPRPPAAPASTPVASDKARPAAAKSAGGRPTREAAARLERRILDVAAALFASQGYAATTMEQVADACKAGKDTIYRRYASKGALFTALMEDFRAGVTDELNACMAVEDAPRERLRRYARTLLEINLRPRLVALNRVALGEAVPSKGVQPTPAGEDPFMRRMAELVKETQAAGMMAQGDAYFIAEQLLYATAIKPLIATMLGETRYADPDGRQAYFDRAWQLFMAGAESAREVRAD